STPFPCPAGQDGNPRVSNVLLTIIISRLSTSVNRTGGFFHLLNDLYHTLHNIRLISHTGIHCVLNLVQAEDIGHNIPDADPAGGYGFYRFWIDVPVAEHGLKGELLVQRETHGKRHFSGCAVANK